MNKVELEEVNCQGHMVTRKYDLDTSVFDQSLGFSLLSASCQAWVSSFIYIFDPSSPVLFHLYNYSFREVFPVTTSNLGFQD